MDSHVVDDRIDEVQLEVGPRERQVPHDLRAHEVAELDADGNVLGAQHLLAVDVPDDEVPHVNPHGRAAEDGAERAPEGILDAADDERLVRGPAPRDRLKGPRRDGASEPLAVPRGVDDDRGDEEQGHEADEPDGGPFRDSAHAAP